MTQNLRLFVWTLFIILVFNTNNTASEVGSLYVFITSTKGPNILQVSSYPVHLKTKNKFISEMWFIVISIQPLGQFGKEPEPSQVTSMALVCCILGKFLGVVCYCFPPKCGICTKKPAC